MSLYDFILTKAIKFLQKKQKQHRRQVQRKKKADRVKKRRERALSVKKKSAPKKRKLKPKKRILKKKKKRAVKKVKAKPKSKPKPKIRPKPKAKHKLKPKKAPVDEQWVGDITHFFSNISVVVIKMTSGTLHVGDKIHVKGNTTDFNQHVKSLQIESVDVPSVKKGELVGLKVIKKAKAGDQVFKILK